MFYYTPYSHPTSLQFCGGGVVGGLDPSPSRRISGRGTLIWKGGEKDKRINGEK